MFSIKSNKVNSVLLTSMLYLWQSIPQYIQEIAMSSEPNIRAHFSVCTRLLAFLRSHSLTSYRFLSDICVIDRPNTVKRFTVNYIIMSLNYNSRLVVSTQSDGLFPIVSCSLIYQNANWSEREAWDMFGLTFLGHTDLRRILTDYGFIGFPLRKDFPLTGIVESRYSANLFSVVQDRLSLLQGYRAMNGDTIVSSRNIK